MALAKIIFAVFWSAVGLWTLGYLVLLIIENQNTIVILKW